MHTHRPLFVSRRVNRVIDVLCCMPAALTAAEMREVHVLNHHRYNDGPGDVTSTEGREQGLRAVWYWIRYGTIVKNHTVRTIFAANASPGRRKRRHQFMLDFTLVVALMRRHLVRHRHHPVHALLLDPVHRDPGELRLLRLADPRPGAGLRGRPEQIDEHGGQLAQLLHLQPGLPQRAPPLPRHPLEPDPRQARLHAARSSPTSSCPTG